MSSFRADDFIEKMDTKDPDFRYMAVEDLLKECQKPDFKMDAKVEPKIVAKIVYMIGNDSSGDVKSVAMKCISPLSNKVSEEQFKAIIEGLSAIIFVQKAASTPETQDISTMALKFILIECAESKGDYFVADLAPKLTDNINKPKTPETVWFCLDLQNDILARWGRQMSAQGQTGKLLAAVLPHLTSDNNRARNKAIGCLGYICLSLPEAQLNDLISKLLAQAKAAKKKEALRAYLMALAAVCRSADRGRVAQHLNNILPVVLENIDNQNEDFQDDYELKDNSLQCLEAILNRCPKETDASFAKVQATTLKFISWDPILVQVDEDDGDAVIAEDDDGFVDEDDGLLLGDSDEVVDDEDESWKVRKAATRCVSSIIKTRPDKLSQIFEEILPVLIKRFTEREESVKLDVMAVVGEILREAQHITRAEKDSKTSQTILAKLATVAPQIYKSAVKELTSKSPKSKISGFQLLKELAIVAPGAITDSNFVEGVTLALVPSSSSPLKIQALEFLRAVVNPQTAPAFLDKLGDLTKSIYVAVNDVYYKVVAEALRVVSQLIRTLSTIEGFKADQVAGDLFSAVLPKLKLTDVDLEVKDTAIEAAGLLVSLLGGKLKPAQVEECFSIFQTRLANELTRINSIKTISQTAKAKVGLGNVLGDTVKALGGFLNKTNRLLIQVSLIALFDIISGPDGQLKPAASHYEQLLKDLSVLLEGQDLQLAHLGLQVVKAVLHANPALASSANTLIIPKTNTLLVQPTFQGPALHSLVSVYEELKGVNVVDGLTKLAGTKDLQKSSIHAIAQCIAASVAGNAQGREAVLTTFIKNIADAKDENQKLLALYTVGEIGTKTDITGAANLSKNVLASFDSSSVEVKAAASVSFGCICSSNISKFLEELKASPQRKFLLLGSLREIIVRLSASPEGKTVINPHFEHLLATLLEQTAHEEEDTRNIVSECLGKLTVINPEAVVLALAKRTSDENPHTRACVTSAIKFSIQHSDKPLPVDQVLVSNISSFLNLLNDKEVKVRHAVVASLLQSAHHKPSVIRDSLPEFLPVIYDQARIRPELIKEIECGPIKHRIDEGLETRQAAFELMFTLLETCLSRLELQAFITKLVSGLADEYDIQLLNHQIIIRLAKNAKSSLVAGLEQLLAPLTICVNTVPKDVNNTDQVEKNTTLIRSAMRAIAAINHIPDVADNCPQFQEFMKSKILGVEKLSKVYAEVTK